MAGPGDLGRIDGEGFLYIEDRAKDMVLRAGENVYCAEVESAIYEHPDVYEAAVFGVPDERLGEEVACVVQRKEGADLTAEELTGFLAERLAPYKIPAGWLSPRTACPEPLGQDPEAGARGSTTSGTASGEGAPAGSDN